MPEEIIARIMLWGAVRFAMVCFGISFVFAMVIITLKDKHKRNWFGAMALCFALIATSTVFYYYTNGKQMARIELLKAMYFFPESLPYHNGGTISELEDKG